MTSCNCERKYKDDRDKRAFWLILLIFGIGTGCYLGASAYHDTVTANRINK